MRRGFALDEAFEALTLLVAQSTGLGPVWTRDSGHQRAKSPAKSANARAGAARTVTVLTIGGTGNGASLFFILGVVAAPFLPETKGKPLPHALWREGPAPS